MKKTPRGGSLSLGEGQQTLGKNGEETTFYWKSDFHYPIHIKEALAVKFALEQYKSKLEGKKSLPFSNFVPILIKLFFFQPNWIGP